MSRKKGTREYNNTECPQLVSDKNNDNNTKFKI